jgi:uncharacterized protein (TIGR02145 family)
MDAQGNAYRVRRMPDGKVWMRENLRTQAPYGPNAWANGVQRNGMSYSWAQALAKDSTCSASTCPVSGQQRGICPSGWHLSDSVSWAQLVRAVAGSDPDSVGFRKLRADSGWMFYRGSNMGGSAPTFFGETNNFGIGIYQTNIWSYSWKADPFTGSGTPPSGGGSYYGAAFWTKDGLLTFLDMIAIGRDTTIVANGTSTTYTYPNTASVRCVLDQ